MYLLIMHIFGLQARFVDLLGVLDFLSLRLGYREVSVCDFVLHPTAQFNEVSSPISVNSSVSAGIRPCIRTHWPGPSM